MKAVLLFASLLALTACKTTYTEKKDEIAKAIVAEIPDEIDKGVAADLASCIATEATAVADQLGCEVPKEYTDLREPLAECVKEKGGVEVLQVKLGVCLSKAREALMKLLPPPQPA